MLTGFGKTLRKIRIDHNELLKDMAKRLNVTVAYLSAVENGNREVPDKWVDMISDSYNLTSAEKTELQRYAYEDKDSLKINISTLQKEEKDLALAFARSFKTLSDEERQELLRIFNK